MDTLTVDQVTKSFQGRVVVDRVSLTIRQGEIVGLLGPNGAGKTTTFRMILGLHTPESGSIRVGDDDITTLPIYRRARLGINFLPQEPSVLRGLTVEENLLAVCQLQRRRRHQPIAQVLAEMGLTPLRKRKAGLLSGGERRRLEIARALLHEPRFLLLDEPFAGIDPIQIGEIQGMIRTFRDRGLGIVITDHNVREILKITDRSTIVHQGRIIFSGPAAELIADERVRREYLGREFRWN